MKKLLLFVAMLGTGATLFAQGTISFANSASTLITTNDFYGHSGNVTGSTGAYHYELVVAPLGTTNVNSPLFTVLATITNSPSLGGRFFGGTVSNNAVGPGGGFALYVRGWLADGPGQVDYASARVTGITPILQLAASGNPTTTPPGTAASIFGAGLLQGFEITPLPIIPEPSSIVLGVLGLGVIALFQRRK